MHCASQLQAFCKIQSRLADAGVFVAAVSSDSAKTLTEAYLAYRRDNQFPFLLLADEKLKAFKSYGCFNGEPLHGTFVLDGSRHVFWQTVGPEPFMDVNAVLQQLSPDADPHRGERAGARSGV